MNYLRILFLFLCWVGMHHSAMAKMITTREEAQALAEEYIRREPTHDFVITGHETKPYGWIFSYTTRAYTHTHHPNDTVLGNGPLVIGHRGEIFAVTTSMDPARAIQILDDSYQKTQNLTKTWDALTSRPR